MLRQVGIIFSNVADCQRAAMSFSLPRSTLRAFGAKLFVAAVAALIVGLDAQKAVAQFRESFESTIPSWRLREADCGVRRIAQERTFLQSHSGNGSEYLRLGIGNGTYVRLAHPVGKAAVIAELVPSVWVKSDKPNLQIMLRVVFPKTIDEGTGQPLTDFVLGDSYTDIGRWQELKVTEVPDKLNKVLWARRRQLALEKKKVDESGAYVDMVVLNAYSSPGNIDIWLDDLEIQGYVSLEDAGGGKPTTTTQKPELEARDPRNGASLKGSLLMVNGRPLMPRIIEHNGEPLEWLHSLGFNAVKLRAEPTPKELKEAQRLGLWLVAPPPVVSEETPMGAAYYSARRNSPPKSVGTTSAATARSSASPLPTSSTTAASPIFSFSTSRRSPPVSSFPPIVPGCSAAPNWPDRERPFGVRSPRISPKDFGNNSC
jgi:hypothetical protein